MLSCYYKASGKYPAGSSKEQKMEEHSMSNVRRIYVEKKPAFAVQAKELKSEIKSYLGISSVEKVRVLIRYDIENISDATYAKAVRTVFSEPPVDDVYEETFDLEGARTFSVEFLPGQFDQRADSAEQCVKLLNENEDPIIRSATTYVIYGTITEEQFAAIKAHCINPVDSRETDLNKPETLVTNFKEPEDVKIFDGFTAMAEDDRDPCSGYLLVGSLPPYDILHRIKGRDIRGRRLQKADRGYLRRL